MLVLFGGLKLVQFVFAYFEIFDSVLGLELYDLFAISDLKNAGDKIPLSAEFPESMDQREVDVYLSHYLYFTLGVAAISFIYLIILDFMRINTFEFNKAWYYAYLDLIFIESRVLFCLLFLVVLRPYMLPVDKILQYYGCFATVVSYALVDIIEDTYLKYAKYVVGPVFDPKAASCEGKVYMVTGCNTGIGYQTALELAKRGGTVVMACRTPSKADAARKEILETLAAIELSEPSSSSSSDPDTEAKTETSKETSSAKAKSKAEDRLYTLPLDLNSFKSVRACVAAFKKLDLPLHCLVNNAGLMMETRNTTEDGLEMVMTANHLAHFLFTCLLVPQLQATAQKELKNALTADASLGDRIKADRSALTPYVSRVVNLSSALHKSVKRFDFDDIMSEKCYSMFPTYSQSKLANLLFTHELKAKLGPLSASNGGNLVMTCSVHPGCVRTDVTRHMNQFVQVGNAMAAPVMKWLQKTPQEGAYSSLHCAVTAQVVETALDLDNKDNKKVGGEHYFNCQVVEQGEGVRSDDAKRLWTVSEEYVGEKFDF